MKPLKTPHADRHCELFRSELIQIINLKHAATFWRPVRTGRPKSYCHIFFVLSGT